MARLPLSLDKGRKTSGSQLRLPPGFLARVENAIYEPDDPDRLHKIPGRTTALSLVGDQQTTPRGLQLLQYPNGDDQLLLLANNQLYEQDAGTSLGAWTSVNDLAGSPAPFARTGTYLKTVADSLKRTIVWTGSASERSLVRDEDGNWRFLGLKKPLGITVAETTSTPTIIRPDAAADPDSSTVVQGTVDSNFVTPANAFDGDLTTPAQGTLEAAGIVASDFTFTDGGSTSSHRLYVKIGTSSTLIENPDADPTIHRGGAGVGGAGGQNPSEPLIANVFVNISTTGPTGTFTTVYVGAVPVGVVTIQTDLTDSILWTNVVVQVVFQYVSGTIQATCLPYEIFAQEDTAGNAAVVTQGDYQYTHTEFYSVTLASGEILFVESAPCDIAGLTLDGADETGVIITFGAAQNVEADGVKNDPPLKLLKRRVYRTTKTGQFPDLGYIGDADSDATTFVDTFTIDGTTLGAPGLSVVYVGDAAYPLAGQPPNIRDMTIHRGAAVCIPEDDPYVIRWTPRGFPDYWPFPHEFPFLSKAGNDEPQGVVSISDNLMIFLRSSVLRIRDLPMATSFNFNLEALDLDTLSPNEGLAGGPKGYTEFHSQKGHAVVAWVSDNGIWMSDGSLVSERGLGVIKLSSHKDWNKDVDTSQLSTAELVYDPTLQMLVFDYDDLGGVRRTEYLHTSPVHWVEAAGITGMPKWTGPHSLVGTARAIGEFGGVYKHWNLNATDLKIYNERTGTDNAGTKILTHIEGGWIYPAGPRDDVHVYQASLYHSDWGAAEQCQVVIEVRDDETGIISSHHCPGVPLRGERVSQIGMINLMGQSVRMSINHEGATSSLALPTRAFGPVMLDLEVVDEIRR